jgi:Asp-tRNA(Asn)/Glu-tRNA(Gln) amidotransferase B subunit
MAKFYEEVVYSIIVHHADKWEQAKASPSLREWFVARVMLACDGKADPLKVRRFLDQQAERNKAGTAPSPLP